MPGDSTHIKKIVYADNAATTALDKTAYETMLLFLNAEFANPSQPYSISRNARKAIQQARETVAKHINAEPEEIFFTSGGTESDNWAIKGSAFTDLERRATITSAIEHHAILRSCQAIEKLGYPVAYISPTKLGIITAEALSTVISPRTRLVSIMLANNEIGTIEPIEELSQVAHENGAIFHTDAVQAVGHISLDVRRLGVDMLSASAHKFGGPKGIGFLYIKNGTSIAPYMDGGGQESNMRAGTENVAGIVGMAKALEVSCDRMKETRKRLREMESEFMRYLTESRIDYIRNGDENRLPGHMSISLRGMDGEAILHRLDLCGIQISTGAACDSKKTTISHVISEIAVPAEYARGTIRVTFGRNNTIDEALYIAKHIETIVKNVRNS